MGRPFTLRRRRWGGGVRYRSAPHEEIRAIPDARSLRTLGLRCSAKVPE